MSRRNILEPTYLIVSEQTRHQTLAEQLATTLNGKWLQINERNAFDLQFLNEVNPDYIFIPHWSYKIASEITERFACVMFHMTDLPFGRGGSPLQNLIVRGFKETKLSAFRCVEELDAGPIYKKAPLSLQGSAEEIFKRADQLVIELITDIVINHPVPQLQSGAPSYFKRRTAEQGNIEKLTNIDSVYNHIRMLDAQGYPNAFIELENLQISFSKAKITNGELKAEVVFKEKTNGR